MATITKLPSGKYRAQVRRQGVYRAQSFSRKIDAQGWAVEIERAIESGSSRGLMRPAAGMTLQDVIVAYTEQVKVPRAAFVVTGFFIIFNSNWGKDEPQTLHYAITQNCSMGADGGHSGGITRGGS